MAFFKNLFKKEDSAETNDKTVVAPVEGTLVSNDQISDPVFAQEMMGKTIAFEPKNGQVVSPANGVLEVVFPSGHAFAVRMSDGTGILVHIGINTVSLDGKGFEKLANQGDTVKAGQPIVNVDLDTVKEAGFPVTTMLIVTENPTNREFNYKSVTEVKAGETLL